MKIMLNYNNNYQTQKQTAFGCNCDKCEQLVVGLVKKAQDTKGGKEIVKKYGKQSLVTRMRKFVFDTFDPSKSKPTPRKYHPTTWDELKIRQGQLSEEELPKFHPTPTHEQQLDIYSNKVLHPINCVADERNHSRIKHIVTKISRYTESDVAAS